MHALKNKKALTLIETVISAFIVSTLILASVQLMSFIYRSIIATQFKTYSINIASEHVDHLKSIGFNALNITPDSCLPDPLSNLETTHCGSNPYPVELVPINNKMVSVYRIVQYAVEDGDGNLQPKTLAEMSAGLDMKTKMITVITAYEVSGDTRTTRLTGLLTDKEIPLAGSTINGTIFKHLSGGSDVSPGAGSGATVYFVGNPGYTTQQYDANGNFTVTGVMPGSYIMYAQGLGFEQTYYASNPLNVSIAGSTINNVNFYCPAIEGAYLSGHVYINITMVASSTPTITEVPVVLPTDTPVIITQLLPATGAMTSKTPQWTNPSYISSPNDSGAMAETTNQIMYTEFQDYTEASTIIYGVRITNRIVASACGTGNLQLYFTNDSGGHWNNTASPSTWSTTTLANVRVTQAYSSGWVNRVADITNLYTTWDWAKVNALGMALKSAHTSSCLFGFIDNDGYCDYSYLSVDYAVATYTPTTAAPTATYTETPVPTSTPIPCADGSTVRAMDGLSLPATSASCNYFLQDINPAGGFTSVSATFNYGGQSYYKYMTGVPVALGVTTTVDIWLEESTGVPTLNGFVFDAINRTLPIVGASVYLSDPNDITPTTTGGGTYTFMPAVSGNWQLMASKPGYKLEAVHTLFISAGINNAPSLYLYPAGDIAGTVTDDITGDPIAGVSIEVRNAADTVIGTGYTESDGTYMLKTITAGVNYKVRFVPLTNYECVFPATGQYSGVAVVQGTTASNKNFRIKQSYSPIRGKIAIDGADILDGVTVIAYPSSVTIYAHHYRADIDAQHLRGQTGRSRVMYPYNAIIAERNADFEILAPVGYTYNVFAYYTRIVYTGTVNDPVRTVKKYYKYISSVNPGSDDNDITGNLSSWTEY